jgi:hypothetical protein
MMGASQRVSPVGAAASAQGPKPNMQDRYTIREDSTMGSFYGV